MGNRCRKEYYALGVSLTNNPTICRDYLCRIEETVIIIVNIAKTIIVEIRKFVVYLVVAILIIVYLTSIDAEMEMRTSNIPGVPSRFMRKFICRLRLSEVSRQ